MIIAHDTSLHIYLWCPLLMGFRSDPYHLWKMRMCVIHERNSPADLFEIIRIARTLYILFARYLKP